MTYQSGRGPVWDRNRGSGFNLGRVILIIVACIAAPWIGMNVLHGARSPSFSFGGPDHHQLAQLGHAFDAQLDADNQNYKTEMKQAAPEQFLMPEALARSGGLMRAANSLARRRQIVAKYQALYTQRKSEERARVSALYASSGREAEAAQAFDNGSVKLQADMDAYWGLQLDIIDRQDALVGFLTHERGAWTAVGRKVLFLRPDLVRSYNGYVGDLREREAELQTLIARMNFETTQHRAEMHGKLGE